MFLFGEFNIHHKDWLTYSGGTDRPSEPCYSFPISEHLTQMVNVPSHIPGCDSHSPALLDFFLSSDISVCSTMAFPALENSDHVQVLTNQIFSDVHSHTPVLNYQFINILCGSVFTA